MSPEFLQPIVQDEGLQRLTVMESVFRGLSYGTWKGDRSDGLGSVHEPRHASVELRLRNKKPNLWLGIGSVQDRVYRRHLAAVFEVVLLPEALARDPHLQSVRARVRRAVISFPPAGSHLLCPHPVLTCRVSKHWSGLPRLLFTTGASHVQLSRKSFQSSMLDSRGPLPRCGRDILSRTSYRAVPLQV